MSAEKTTPKFDLKSQTRRRLVLLQCCVRCFWSRMIACSLGNKPVVHYRVLQTAALPPPQPSPIQIGGEIGPESDSDLVPLKISLLGDPHIGKTSFVTKYVGNERQQDPVQGNGFNLIDKTFSVKGATISFSIWEVDGDEKSKDHIPVACKDSVAILFMFDLTTRCTLNSVLNWYQQARKYNQSAIPVLVGTKFDDFIQLPMDLQWTIASEARGIAKALNATLFFSSATYNINVNKIFKFITAKLFDLPWTVERNLTIGEPIIDF